MKYFVFLNAPDCPQMIYAIYNNYNDAKKYAVAGNGYLQVRIANWEDGQLPLYRDTSSVREESK